MPFPTIPRYVPASLSNRTTSNISLHLILTLRSTTDSGKHRLDSSKTKKWTLPIP